MPKEAYMAGCAATANAAKLARVEVITSYPIRPYTGIMMELSRMVAAGELDAEFIHGEGEHAQVSVTQGASASGARAYTGSSGVGLAYAMEVYSPISGGRYPCQMAVADRAYDPPGDFGSEHTDVMSCSNQGWILGWAETPEESMDNCIIYYRIGEDAKVMLPQWQVQDGYFVSHIPNKVSIPDQEAIDEYLPPYNCPHALSPQNPTNHGPQIFPDQGPAIDLQRAQAFLNTPKVVEKAIADYNKAIGRKYTTWLEEYKTDGAEFVFFMMGGHCRTARFAVDHLRKKGAKAGLVKLRFVRPWPTEQVCEVLSKFKAVGVVESQTNYGGAMKGGELQHEVRASLYDSPKQPACCSFMAGLGGEVISLEEFFNMAKVLEKMAKSGKAEQYVYWCGFDNGI